MLRRKGARLVIKWERPEPRRPTGCLAPAGPGQRLRHHTACPRRAICALDTRAGNCTDCRNITEHQRSAVTRNGCDAVAAHSQWRKKSAHGLAVQVDATFAITGDGNVRNHGAAVLVGAYARADVVADLHISGQVKRTAIE